MSKLHFETFNEARKSVFRTLAEFKDVGILAGGTAISLQLGHRYSYDFDVFTSKPIAENLLVRVMEAFGRNIQKLVDSPDELSFLTPKKVKISFVHFPFPDLHRPIKTKAIPLFNLRDLASNKAYVIGRRGEYRDYVDLFFLLKEGLSLKKIINEAKKRFKGAFSERLFLEQLVYFKDLKDFRIDFLRKKYEPKQIYEFFQREIKRRSI